jgi:hypothetical protein
MKFHGIPNFMENSMQFHGILWKINFMEFHGNFQNNLTDFFHESFSMKFHEICHGIPWKISWIDGTIFTRGGTHVLTQDTQFCMYH